MKNKKTWFSYPMWFLAAVLTGVLLAVYLSAFIADVWQFNKYWTAVAIGLVFAAVAGIWFLGRKAAALFMQKVTEDRHLQNMWECFLVMCIFAGAVLYKIHMVLHFSGTLEKSVFYDMASVKSSGGVQQIAHGASYMYTVILSALLSFTGNKVAAGVVLQMVFQVIGLLVFYFAVRLLTGRTEAVCAMAVMAFSPLVNKELFRITPEVLFFLLYSVGLLLLGLYGWKYGSRCRKKSSYLFFALSGIYTGIMGYLDMAGWTLLFFAGFLCVRETMQEKSRLRDGIYKFLAFLLPAGAVMSGLCFLDAILTRKGFLDALSIWGKNAVEGSWQLHFPTGPDTGLAAGIVICICTAFAVIGFWFHEEQKQDAWIVFLVALTVFEMLDIGQLRYEMFITSGWSVLAGLGIASLGGMTVCNALEKMVTGDSAAVNAAPLAELIIEDISLDAAEEKPEIKFIENPLPLPKKHVKKTMDYDRNIEEPKMDFDISVDENDDFDL